MVRPALGPSAPAFVLASASTYACVRDPIQVIKTSVRSLDQHGIVEKDLHPADFLGEDDDQRKHAGMGESRGEG